MSLPTRLLTFTAALALGLCAAGCGDHDAAGAAAGGGRGGGKGRDGAQGTESRPVRDVRVTHAETASLPRTVALSGTLVADRQVELAIKVAGRLAAVDVDLGTRVRRGQVIARLAPADFTLRVSQAESALAQARARLGIPADGPDRLVDPADTSVVKQAQAVLVQSKATRDRVASLVAQDLLPRANLDDAEANLQVADAKRQDAVEEARNRQGLLAQRRSELDIARQALADSVVVAPFDGIIRERRVQAGDYVTAGQPVATLVGIDPLRLRLAVPERESHGVRVGQPVSLSVEGDPRSYQGRIARLSPAISEDNRTLAVEAEIPNPEASLRPGAFAQAEITIQEGAAAILVPASSVVTFAGINKVIGVKDGKAEEKRVELGRRSGDRVEVVDGIEDGETVVVEPGNLVSGDPVRIVSQGVTPGEGA